MVKLLIRLHYNYQIHYLQHWRIILTRRRRLRTVKWNTTNLNYKNIYNIQKQYWIRMWKTNLRRRKIKKIFSYSTFYQTQLINTNNQLWNHQYKKPTLLSYYKILQLFKLNIRRYRRKPILRLHTRLFESDLRIFFSCPITNYYHPRLAFTRNLFTYYWNFMYIYRWKLIY